MRENYAHCAAEVRAHDKDRFLATLFAPANARPHLFALYAFNLELARVRDRTQEPAAGEVRLQWWREAVEGQRTEEAAGHPVAAALLDAVARCSLRRHLLSELIDVRSFDLYDDPMPSLAELEAYADASSGELIRLATTVLAGKAAPLDATTHAGRALAFTALLRVLPLHAARGQVYVPADLLARHGANPEDVVSGDTTPALQSALAELRAIAARELEAARAQLKNVPPQAAPAFLPLALVPLYLGRMQREGYNPFRTPVDLPQWRRQWTLWRAARRGVI
jgi:phytoene synthase